MSNYDFSGKVAVVTGAGRGIGRAYAEGLAHAGAAVLVADIDGDNADAVAKSITASGGRAEGTVVDVSSPDSALAMAAVATEHFGGIDFLVNNAAIFGGMKLDFLLTVDWEYLERFLAVNLTGALACTRACYPSMSERGGGAIVNQSSTAAYLYAGYYGWAKAGVNSLTQQLAHELGSMKIRVNAIAPGPTLTDITQAHREFLDPLIATLPSRGYSTPAQIGATAVFLASDDAANIHGAIISVDGGFTAI